MDFCVTNLKSDIVILDSQKKQLNIFELTCQLTSNKEKRNLEKSKKYAPFLKDITGMACTVLCFEVSSTSFINARNQSTLTTLHSFIQNDMKK